MTLSDGFEYDGLGKLNLMSRIVRRVDSSTFGVRSSVNNEDRAQVIGAVMTWVMRCKQGKHKFDSRT